MRLISLLICLVLGSTYAVGQDGDGGLESLSLPADEPKARVPEKKATEDLSLPSGNTATSSVGKASVGGSLGKKENVGAILDFEGEVIEGERRRPDLFLQISIDNVKFDSLIYNRDDFNDYLEVDRKSRTRFLKMK